MEEERSEPGSGAEQYGCFTTSEIAALMIPAPDSATASLRRLDYPRHGHAARHAVSHARTTRTGRETVFEECRGLEPSVQNGPNERQPAPGESDSSRSRRKVGQTARHAPHFTQREISFRELREERRRDELRSAERLHGSMVTGVPRDTTL